MYKYPVDGLISSQNLNHQNALNFHITKRQLLCNDAEGWGPFSSRLYDFTPCFLDIWTVVVSLFGITFGAGAIIHLLRSNSKQLVNKDWHFWTKHGILVGIILCTITQFVLQIVDFDFGFIGDFRSWSTLLNLSSILVISYLQYIEHSRLKYPNGVVLFYWLFSLLVYATKLRSLASRHVFHTHLAYFVIYSTTLGLALLEFTLEWLVPKQVSDYDALGMEDECPYESANIFSVLTFSWLTPMVRLGSRKFLTADDLWNLGSRDASNASAKILQEKWELELKKQRPSLWRAMIRAFGKEYLSALTVKTYSDFIQYVQPILLSYLISFVSSYSTPYPQSPIRGVVISLGMLFVSLTQILTINQYYQTANVASMRLKASLISIIYQKSAKLSNESRSARPTGDIVNYAAVDAQRIEELGKNGLQIWSSPIQIVLCVISLYYLLGPSMFAGVGIMVLMIPTNGLISRTSKRLQKKQMKNKDQRTRLMTEILNNMKSIKLYAWSAAFINKLNHVRNDLELNNLRKIATLGAASNFSLSTAYVLVSAATFGVFVLTEDRPLTTELVFPALTLINLLQFPLAMLPMIINSWIEAAVAVTRLRDFLISQERQPDAVTKAEPPIKVGDESVSIVNGTFTWDKNSDRDALTNITYTATKGELSCVVGRVGTGKSTFLQTMLGDVYKKQGKVIVRGNIAYVAQSPWVMNASARENIIFGHRWDSNFYERTIKACALLDDFAILPDGDRTQVGERGISLSGGQKARLTLARAVYARADIYLLDDVLSAVDQNVGRHIIDNVLGPHGILKSKTRILATNSLPVLMEANYIILLREGRILEHGTYEQLMAMKGELANVIKTANSEPTTVDDEQRRYSRSETSQADDYEFDDGGSVVLEDSLSELPIIRMTSTRSHRPSESKITLRKASMSTFVAPHDSSAEDDDKQLRTKRQAEHSEQGKVKWKIYLEYAKACNIGAIIVYILFLCANHSSQVGSAVWLKWWAEHNEKTGSNAGKGHYWGVYAGFVLAIGIFVIVQNLTLQLVCGIEASRKLHETMAHAIFRSPMSFFDSTPIGRILNRFTLDVYRLDESLPQVFNILFVQTFKVTATLGVICASTPTFIAVIIPLGAFYVWVQKFYLQTSRELKRLESVSKSPLYAHFQESLNGMVTIRAYDQLNRFSLENEFRIDATNRAYFPLVSAYRWLSMRLETIGSAVIFGTAIFAVISVSTGGSLSAGMFGLAMSYALQITTAMNWIVRATVEVENNIVSVERILEYSALPSEAPEVISRNRPPTSWPHKGALSFNNYSTRYRPELDPVLQNIDLDIKAHEKIGVVGRTGAGKSSLTLALFRIIEGIGGNITIDGVDIGTIGLLDLRRRLAIIPQDAAIFEGTVRDNLDPSHVHDDTELWSAIEHARLRDHISSMPGKLDAQVSEGGSNLSQGQRQLVSLARALLTPSNILVLDEATAAVDVETDQLIQTTLRSSAFKDRTIITIAHRINTILDSDRVVVLDKGKVAELGSPKDLTAKKGLFYELVKEAGLLNAIDRDAGKEKR